MKLKSGKILSTFPSKLDKKLDAMLQDFKVLFSDNPKHAKELLDIISEIDSIGYRFVLRGKIEEVYDVNNLKKTTPLMESAGELAWLLVDNPIYHDIIETRIKNFDLETPLLGNMED
jgi:hypothetical protein